MSDVLSQIVCEHTNTACMCLQQEPLEAAEQLCSSLLIRAESLRMAVCHAGAQYRQFFAWLLRTIRRLNDDNPSAATEAAAIRVDSSDIAAFLHGQFEVDAIGPELWVGSCIPMSAGVWHVSGWLQSILTVKRLNSTVAVGSALN